MSKSKKSTKRINQKTINKIIDSPHLQGIIPKHLQAEMAIPSYTNNNPFIRMLFWKRYDKIYQLSNLNKDFSVCEFGCGIGVFLPTLADEVSSLYAVDIYPQYAKELAKTFNLDVKFSTDLFNIPDHSLDLIIACEVMEHLDDPLVYSRLFIKKLKRGGRLIMSGPNETLIYKFGRFLAGYHKYHDYHINNVFQIHSILSNNGFKTLSTNPYPAKLLPLFMVNVYESDILG